MAGRKLGRTSSHRKALFANLATALLEHGQIRTTLPKAKDLRRVVEPLITKARAGDLAARREVSKVIKNETILKKLFDEIAPRFKETPGGYTRVLKAGFRQGDNAAMAIIELTEGKKAEKKAAPKKASAKKAKENTDTEAKVEAVPAEEVKEKAPKVEKTEVKEAKEKSEAKTEAKTEVKTEESK